MSCADSIAKLLVAGGFSEVFSKVSPPALVCADPIVVSEGAFERTSRGDGEERGTVTVGVAVVRELCGDAEDIAARCERLVRCCDWETEADAGDYRIVGVDTTAPRLDCRDASGRYIWRFDVEVTAVRSL